MNKKSFLEYYGKLFNVNTFEDAYLIYQSLSDEEKKKHYKIRSEIARKKSLEKDPDRYKKVSEKLKGRKRSKELCEKVSIGLKKYYENSENRIKTSKIQKEYWSTHNKSKESIEKQKQTLKATYENRPEIKQQISESVKNYYKEHPEHHKEISEKTRAAMETFYKTEKGQENLKKWAAGSRQGGHSGKEDEIAEFIKSLGFNIEQNNRFILNGKELDIYVPSKNIAIELNGLIWHSEKFKPNAKYCHLDKTIECEKQGIRLIHIFIDEWREKREIVESIIASALGVYKKKYFARKMQVKEVSPKDAKTFFNTNHIAGFAPSASYIGLYDDNNTLVQCASFGKNRFTRNKNIELIRMATQLNCQVVGGFSKLIKHSGYEHIESFIDRRLYNGSGYKSSGFSIVGYSGPRYYYTDGRVKENRMKYMKALCLKKWPEASPEKTEHEICLEHGLFRIFDCGTIKVEI